MADRGSKKKSLAPIPGPSFSGAGSSSKGPDGPKKVPEPSPGNVSSKPSRPVASSSDDEDDVPLIQRVRPQQRMKAGIGRAPPKTNSLPQTVKQDMKAPRPKSSNRSPKSKKRRLSDLSVTSAYTESDPETTLGHTPTLASIKESRRGYQQFDNPDVSRRLSKNQLEHRHFFGRDLPKDQHFRSQKPTLIDNFSNLSHEDYDNLSYPVEVRSLTTKGTYFEIDNADDLRDHADDWVKKEQEKAEKSGKPRSDRMVDKNQKGVARRKTNLAVRAIGKHNSVVSRTKLAPSPSFDTEDLDDYAPDTYHSIYSQRPSPKIEQSSDDVKALLDSHVQQLAEGMLSVTATAAKRNSGVGNSDILQGLSDRFMGAVKLAQKTYEKGLQGLEVLTREPEFITDQEPFTNSRRQPDPSQGPSSVIDLTAGYFDSETE